MVLWLAIAAIIFLRDFYKNFRLGELWPFEFCVLAINLYILIKIVLTTITLI